MSGVHRCLKIRNDKKWNAVMRPLIKCLDLDKHRCSSGLRQTNRFVAHTFSSHRPNRAIRNPISHASSTFEFRCARLLPDTNYRFQ